MGTPQNRRSTGGDAGWRRPVAAAFAVLLLPAALAAGDAVQERGRGAPQRLEVVSSEAKGAVFSVLLHLSEPVAYATSQPDPLTVLVDLKNVATTVPRSAFTGGAGQPVEKVTVEEEPVGDGTPVTRISVRLARPASCNVRSTRNVIRVEVDTSAGAQASARSGAPEPAAPYLPGTSTPVQQAANVSPANSEKTSVHEPSSAKITPEAVSAEIFTAQADPGTASVKAAPPAAAAAGFPDYGRPSSLHLHLQPPTSTSNLQPPPTTYTYLTPCAG